MRVGCLIILFFGWLIGSFVCWLVGSLGGCTFTVEVHLPSSVFSAIEMSF
jgi:hypothetical protein